jgi:NTP pyrophosphatase (non-canonical NTP hydrolase)
MEIGNDLDRVQRIVGEWGTKTFPAATNESIVAHLRDEACELLADGSDLAEEAADCLLLLLHLAHRNGFSLFDAAGAKFAVNVGRDWQTEPNERGYMSHVDAAVS